MRPKSWLAQGVAAAAMAAAKTMVVTRRSRAGREGSKNLGMGRSKRSGWGKSAPLIKLKWVVNM